MKKQILSGLLLAIILSGCGSSKIVINQPQQEVKKETKEPGSRFAYHAPAKVVWWVLGVKKVSIPVVLTTTQEIAKLED